jgi:hypothetical protein
LILTFIFETTSGNQKSIEYEITSTDCWNCISHRLSKNGLGSPQLKRSGRCISVYKYIYNILRGPIGPNILLKHTCGNIRCINPDHIVIKTIKK